MVEKMSRSTFLVIVFIAFFFLYLLLKGFIVFTHDLFMNNEVYKKNYVSGKILKIKTNNNVGKYLVPNAKDLTLKVVDKFEGFEPDYVSDNYETYTLYNENNVAEATFTIGVYDTQLSLINNYDEESYYYEFNHFPLYISDILRNKFLEKYNIENDVDLIKHIRSRDKKEGNIFTSVVSIKENYFFNYIELILPPLENITYLEGDLEGYILGNDNYKRAFIVKDDKLYCFSFSNLDYFNDNEIKSILESIIIK